MNRSVSTLATALLSAAGLAGCAVGQDQQNARAGNTASAQQQQQVPEGGVRDWAKIDTNNDNLIQPAEMEVALKEVGPQGKAAGK